VVALNDPAPRGETLDIGGPDNPTKREIAELYMKLSGRRGKVRHVSTAAMRALCPVVRPFNPVLSRLMAMSIWADVTDQTFEPQHLMTSHPMPLTRVQDFIRERVVAPASATAP
jgi:uncharacterized protein YbjT (DUF2867 family)